MAFYEMAQMPPRGREAGKHMDKPRKPRVSKAKEKSVNEFAIYECLAALGFPDTEDGKGRMFDYLRQHGVPWRVLETRHGPAYYFDKEIINDLKNVMQVNEERRRIAAENREMLRRIEEGIRRLSSLPGVAPETDEEEETSNEDWP